MVWNGYASGEPDTLCYWRGRMIQIEVKVQGNKPMAQQGARSERWWQAGVVVPAPMLSEEVKSCLT